MDGQESRDPIDEPHAFSMDRFEEGPIIGEGRNATVYVAFDHELQRTVALKIARQDTIIDDLGPERLGELGLDKVLREFVDEFDQGARSEYTLLREARLAALVDHPGVVTVLEVGRFIEDGRLAVVMPVLAGKPPSPTSPWWSLLDCVLQLAGGLAALHELGVVHRDLKPDNIVYDEAGRPRIADLGLACRLDDEDAMKHFAGTRRWMAPEVLDHGGGGVQNDIFAFCMIAFELFFGHPPFVDDDAKRAGRISRIERDDLPPGILAVLRKGLAPDPASRWTSMAELIAGLEKVRYPRPPKRRKRWLSAGVTLAGLAAGLGVGMCVTLPEAKADACDEVSRELVDFWNDDVQAELRVVLGTRRAGDTLESFAARWVAVRAQECEAAKRDDRTDRASPCTASVRSNLNATISTLQTPYQREGVDFDEVLARLPAPEYCLEHPEDADYGNGGLFELRNLDFELGMLLASHELELAERRQADYMLAARELSAKYDIARAIFWRAELHHLRAELDEAEADFKRAYSEAQSLDAEEFEGEAMMKLAAVAGAKGDLVALDERAFVARTVFARRRPDRVAELLQVQGLALVEGDRAQWDRGLALLRDAVDMREAQFSHYGGSREPVGRALEGLARGLLAARRPDEAVGVAKRSLAIHELEYGGLTTRAHRLRRLLFVTQVHAGQLGDSIGTKRVLLNRMNEAEDWPRVVDEVMWISGVYAEVGLQSHAIDVLGNARQATVSHGRDDLTRVIDERLVELGFELPTATGI